MRTARRRLPSGRRRGVRRAASGAPPRARPARPAPARARPRPRAAFICACSGFGSISNSGCPALTGAAFVVEPLLEDAGDARAHLDVLRAGGLADVLAGDRQVAGGDGRASSPEPAGSRAMPPPCGSLAAGGERRGEGRRGRARRRRRATAGGDYGGPWQGSSAGRGFAATRLAGNAPRLHTFTNVCNALSTAGFRRSCMVRRTREAAAATREQLLDAAERVFRDHGVTRTSLAEVAAEAGVTRGAVYWHFRDKADLFAAMCERATLPMDAMLEQARESTRRRRSARHAAHAVPSTRSRSSRSDPRAQAVFEIMFHKCELVRRAGRHRRAPRPRLPRCAGQRRGRRAARDRRAGELPARHRRGARDARAARVRHRASCTSGCSSPAAYDLRAPRRRIDRHVPRAGCVASRRAARRPRTPWPRA